MKLVNYFTANARQWDKFTLEARVFGVTLLEIKFDISKKCFKFVVLNLGFTTETCKC